MKEITSTVIRNYLKDEMDWCCKERKPIEITRRGNPNCVLMSKEYYEHLQKQIDRIEIKRKMLIQKNLFTE